MKTLFVLFNHQLTPDQIEEARTSLEIGEHHVAPESITALWSDLPAEARKLKPLLEPVYNWLDREARAGDYVLVQGDFGACFLVVTHCLQRGLVPIYATTRREAREETGPDGAIRTMHLFRHVRFRKYGE